MSTAAIICSIAGGLAELSGLALVVKGIAEDRKRARELVELPPLEPLPERGGPPGRFTESDLRPHGVTALERGGDLKALQRAVVALVNGVLGMRRAVDGELGGVRDELAERIDASDENLRDAVRHILAGGARDRVLGVSLLSLGIVLAVAGSVLSAAS